MHASAESLGYHLCSVLNFDYIDTQASVFHLLQEIILRGKFGPSDVTSAPAPAPIFAALINRIVEERLPRARGHWAISTLTYLVLAS